MRAARVHAIGRPPRVDDVEPDGDGCRVRVRAVALNPLDIAVASGVFYGGHPPLPYVAGAEAVGERVDTGERVLVCGRGLGVARDGTLAETVAAPEAAVHVVPDGVDDAVAVACGIAGLAGWLPVTARADVRADDRVLVLGATGSAGSVAVQAARIRGATRIVAAGRRPERLARALELGAHDTVRLDGGDPAEAFAEAFGGEGPTVVIDYLWGGPLAAALAAAAPGARAVNVGQSAGAETTLQSGIVRGKQLDVLGYSNFALPDDVLQRAYSELCGEVAAGRVEVDVERYGFDRIEDAWERHASGRGTKIVVEF